MNAMDKTRTIEKAEPAAPNSLRLVWSDGTQATVDLSEIMEDKAFAAVRNPTQFDRVSIGDWGHSVEWPENIALGADRLWLETLTALRKEDVRDFLEWRLKHGLSLSKSAEALGLSRRMIAYYSNGEKPVPRHIQLACRGWEVAGSRRRPLDQRRKRSSPQAVAAG